MWLLKGKNGLVLLQWKCGGSQAVAAGQAARARSNHYSKQDLVVHMGGQCAQ